MSALGAAAAADDYVVFCEGVRRLCKIDLLQYKRDQMERRIRSFAERSGIAKLSDYLALIAREAPELERFLDRVTINVSQLWRNPEQWKALGERVIPELAQTGTIRAWSAGSSYGAEAYTLAAVCLAAAPRVRLSILGTDIDSRMVVRAREGRFRSTDARDAPAAAVARWFDDTPDGLVAKPSLRAVTKFEVGDLLRMTPRRASFDLILCRNTVIYFTEPVRDALHEQLVDALRPGGYLLVGSTERVANPKAVGLVPTGPFTYKRS